MEKCIGCELCAGVCPADCIYVRGLDNPPDHPVSPGERYGYVYEINFLRCIHCDLCVEACPTEAITETKLMEFSFTNRNDAIYTKEELLVDDDGRPKHQPWEDWREGDDLHTSGWMRATSPSGSAAFEGQVQWSGELGFGVRAPESGQRASATTPPPAAAAPGHPRAPPAARRPAPGQAGAPGCHRPHAGEGGAVRPRRRQEAPGEGRRRLRRSVVDAGNIERGSPRPGRAVGPAAGRTAGCGRRLMVALAGAVVAAASTTRHPSSVDVGTFAVAAAIVLSGAIGVVVARNPVHSALMLVMTLFGVAVLFVLQQRSLPGRRAGDRLRRRHRGPLPVRDHVPRRRPRGEHRRRAAARPAPAGHRPGRPRHHRPPAAWARCPTGRPGHPRWPAVERRRPVQRGYLLGKSMYTTYLFPFEATAALLIIAVVGAVVLARRPPGRPRSETSDGGRRRRTPTPPPTTRRRRHRTGRSEPERPGRRAR